MSFCYLRSAKRTKKSSELSPVAPLFRRIDPRQPRDQNRDEQRAEHLFENHQRAQPAAGRNDVPGTVARQAAEAHVQQIVERSPRLSRTHAEGLRVQELHQVVDVRPQNSQHQIACIGAEKLVMVMTSGLKTY